MITTVGILGVTHDHSLRTEYELPLELIRELIMEFEPDVICGEVLPSSWERYKRDPSERGYWGEANSEYWELIFPLCEQQNYEFVPIDWAELDVWMDFDPFNRYEDRIREKLKQEQERWFHKQLLVCKNGSLPFNNLEYDRVTRDMYDWLAQVNPQSHLFRWVCRHLIMVQRVKNAVNQHKKGRILCIIGADHNYMLHDQLRLEQDIDLVYPLRK